MNYEKLKTYWYPLFFLKELKDKPIKKTLLGVPLVFVRLNEQVCSFEDRCPHRQVPLSDGACVDNKLQCSYHGWCFNNEGGLDSIPSSKDLPKGAKLNKVGVSIDGQLVWVRLEGNRSFEPIEISNNFSNKMMIKTLEADFIHSIENFLDPTHTTFIHKGLLRSSGPQKMQIRQESELNGFTTFYHLENRQNGWINKLFDPGIDENIASFEMPGMAKIIYRKEKKVYFEVGVFFVPINKGTVQMVTSVNVLKGKIPSAIKFLLLRPFLELAFYQDKKILQSQYKNSNKASYIMSENDLVIDHLLYLLEDKVKGVNKEMLLEL